jgi:hypothetical protein
MTVVIPVLEGMKQVVEKAEVWEKGGSSREKGRERRRHKFGILMRARKTRRNERSANYPKTLSRYFQ